MTTDTTADETPDATSAARPRAVVAGASGFIGTALVAALREDGYDVVTVGRGSGASVRWDDAGAVEHAVDGAALLLNLAGRSVGCRYTDANRRAIWSSRIDTTRQLHRAVARASRPPALWLNASTGTIYRDAMDQPQSEHDGELGSGFSVDVARGWERAFLEGDLPGTRRVALRMAIVLGHGGALGLLLPAARLGLAGPQLDGRWFRHDRYRGIGPQATEPSPAPPRRRPRGGQRFSWIHLDDVVGAVRHVRDDPGIAGPVNLATPEASTNREMMAALRRRVRAPFGLAAPRWLLEIGMLVLRQESELVLKSRWVQPEVLLASGYRFRHTDLDDALAAS
ncbi:epimerase [Litorihabitans aurantiacus]|uniref:NAD-dependent epimerase n=1 Tax=Litorihabitans aurantiacus TaxID=1930061 RepID=A0AA37XDJ5_9MICO|nr:DUF1731 domain-containing protein [Litorihabitans aurantiacus]GMA31350.1 NAD-dependent epimerase [Litorihabitans aurantiacus]